MKKLTSPSATVALALVVLGGAFIGTTAVATNNAQEVTSLCVNNKTKVASVKTRCDRGETRYSIAGGGGSVGPAGPEGPMGPTGPAGADGAPGPMGAPGMPGMPGPMGLQGIPGATGPTGPTGPAGAAGADGADGVDAAPNTVYYTDIDYFFPSQTQFEAAAITVPAGKYLIQLQTAIFPDTSSFQLSCLIESDNAAQTDYQNHRFLDFRISNANRGTGSGWVIVTFAEERTVKAGSCYGTDGGYLMGQFSVTELDELISASPSPNN
jgi:hypothetical protein